MKSYLKFLSRNKLYTAIEAMGLAVSLAFVILIGSYVVQQYHVARENPDWKRIYALGTDEFLGLGYWDKEELEMNIPEVEAVTRIIPLSVQLVEYGDEKIQGPASIGFQVDPEFFDLFPYYPFLEGSPDAFQSADAAVISETLAGEIRRLLRPDEDLLGKPVRIGGHEYLISGIMKDFTNTLFPPVDVLTRAESSYLAEGGKAFNNIGSCLTLYRVRKDVSREEAETKVIALLERNYRPVWGENIGEWKTFRLDEVFFLDSGNGFFKRGNLQMIRLLGIVVLLLLLSAVFNYINLSFALGRKRAKEMATRRLLGAGRKGILWRQIGETILFTAVCFGAALLLAYLLVPMMNNLLSTQEEQMEFLNEDVELRFLLTPGYIAAYLSGILALGLVCGLFPAWSASGYEPVDVIKGTFRRRSKMVFSKVFIVAQNTLSVLLIALALVMEVQMRHMVTRPTHSRVDNLFYIQFPTDYEQTKLFRDKVSRLSFVEKTGMGSGLPGMVNMNFGNVLDDGTRVSMPIILCDTAYFDLLGLEVLEDYHHPRLHSLWLDETAANLTHASDTSVSLARKFRVNGAEPEHVGGIVRDYPVRPASSADLGSLAAGIIIDRPDSLYSAHNLLIGTTGEDQDYERQILEVYREFRMELNGVYETPWRYGFLRDIYRSQLAPALRTVRLLELFTLLSVLIALLGLLAMSTYFADENTKSIAIRKVFGSEVFRELRRSIKSYMLLVGVACLTGIPLAVWAARIYLERFAYRIDGFWWIFVVAVAITVAIAFGTVLWQTLRAARTNPAIELKKE